MPKFRFALDNVLRYRGSLEEEAQRDLAKTLRHRMILQDQLRQMQQTIQASRGELTQGLIGRVDLILTAQFARYSAQVAERAQGIVTRLALAEKQVAAAREKLLAATRDRKALELLR